MCAIRSQQQNPRSTTEYIDQYNVVQDELNECNNSASDYWQTSKKAELKDAQVSDSVISVVYTCKWKQSSIRPAWTEISHMNFELKTYPVLINHNRNEWKRSSLSSFTTTDI